MKRFALAVVLAAAPNAFAQVGYRIEGTSDWWWEATIDNGVTWTQSLLEVPQAVTTVHVRASCSFPPGIHHYFGGAMIDQVITGLNGAGLQDSVTVTDPGFNNQQTLVPRRFGNVLKIDDISDTLPPGAGPAQWGIFQPGFAVGPYTYANPLLGVINFDLHLDGSEGDRLINAWWRNWSPFFPGMPDIGPAFYYINYVPTDQNFIFPTLAVHDLTIRVVPAPGAVVLACVGAGMSLRRRRRTGA